MLFYIDAFYLTNGGRDKADHRVDTICYEHHAVPGALCNGPSPCDCTTTYRLNQGLESHGGLAAVVLKVAYD